jgi:hypothetical protein
VLSEVSDMSEREVNAIAPLGFSQEPTSVGLCEARVPSPFDVATERIDEWLSFTAALDDCISRREVLVLRKG